MNLKRTAVALLCAVILFVSGAVPKAFANWYDDIQSGSWVEIKGQNFVADTFMGVKAYYNETGNSVYHCGEVVERFYREALGLDVEIRSSEPRLRINTPGYKLVTPDFPKAGDVVFVSAEMRGSGGDHWAIVKYYENGYLVLFEQNVIYQGCAGVNRRLKYPSDSYVIFSPVRIDGADKPSQTEITTTEKKTETTSAPTTTLPSTTEKPTTTKAVTTTKPTTTQPTTAKPTTTQKPTTTKKITTTAKPTTTKVVTTKPTTTVPVTTTVSTTVEGTTTEVYHTYIYTTQQTAPVYYSPESHTEVQNEEKNKVTLPLALVCAALASGVAALAVLLIKKRK